MLRFRLMLERLTSLAGHVFGWLLDGIRRAIGGQVTRSEKRNGQHIATKVATEQKHTNGGWGPRGSAGATFAARLSFENVAKSFGETTAVKGVTLDIPAGEVLCLLGPSGCGKSTMLRLAAGVERPTSGRVLLNDREVSGPSVFLAPEKRNVGLMFQDFALFPHLSIIENVAFGLRGLETAAAHQVAGVALRRVGLARYASAYPHMLSGGEQQRVALARAIAPRPGVLLMDEPFSGLDVQLRASMQEETRTVLRETRATCLIVTHDPEEAMVMADRIAIMRDGRLLQVDTAAEVYAQPVDLFVARLFSEINEMACEVRRGLIETPFGVRKATLNGPVPIDTVAGCQSGALAGAELVEDGVRAVLCLRQRSVRICPVGEGRAARVIDRKFLGDAQVLVLAVDGLDDPLRARLPAGSTAQVGDEIGVMVDLSDSLVFRANG